MPNDHAREVIAGGRQPPFHYEHLFPIARYLIEERGHAPIERPERFGFVKRNGFNCELTRRITDEDWPAIKERFVLPDSIGYRDGVIQDNIKRIRIIGIQRMLTEDSLIPIEEWESRQRDDRSF